MIKLTVNASRKYDVIMAQESLAHAGKYICKALGLESSEGSFPDASGKKICIITDGNVDSLYGQADHAVWTSLTECGFDVHKFVFPGGEDHKNMPVIT